MLKSQSLAIEQSEKRERVNALLTKDELTAEERAELDPLRTRLQEIEPEYRAAMAAEGEDLENAKRENGGISPELRERIELRSKASLGRYLVAAMRGSAPARGGSRVASRRWR